MNIIMAIVRQEIFFELKGFGYWILVLLTNSLLLYSLFEDQHIVLRAIELYYVFFVFWNVGIISRDANKGTLTFLQVLPLNGVPVLSARFLASFLLLLLLGVELFLVSLSVRAFDFPNQVSFDNLFFSYWVNYIIVCINSISVVLFIDMLSGANHFRTMGLTLLYCIIHVGVDGDITTALPYWLPPCNFAVNLAVTNVPSQVTGLFPNGKLLGAILSEQLGLAGVLLGVSCYVYSKRCFEQRRRYVYVVLVLIAASAFFCGAYKLSAEYESREQSYKEAIAATEIDAQDTSLGAQLLETLEYKMSVQLLTGEHSMQCQTQLILSNETGRAVRTIPFTLKNYYKIEKIIDNTGKKLIWRRTGDFLEVDLPSPLPSGEQQSIQIDYHGKVREWFTNYDAEPRGFINFISPEMTLLRSGEAWYPIVGKYKLADILECPQYVGKVEQVLKSQKAVHRPVAFAIKVKTDQPMEIVTGLPILSTENLKNGQEVDFASDSAQDIFILAAPYKKTAAADLPVYSAALHAFSAATIQEQVRLRLDFYEKWIPLSGPHYFPIVEIPDFLLNNWLGQSPEYKRISLQNSIMIAESYFYLFPREDTDELELQKLHFEESVLFLWWPRFSTTDPGSIDAGLLSYMYVLYEENILGKDYYESVRQSWLQSEPVSQIANAGIDPDRKHVGGDNVMVKEVFLLLDDIRRSDLGDAGVKVYLQEIHARSISLENRDLNWTDVLQALDSCEKNLQITGYSVEQIQAATEASRQRALHMQQWDEKDGSNQKREPSVQLNIR
ncbi:hypothetical protein SAMN05660742_12623 [Propionispira arboris]|uniref:ABC-type transport system involved in multi-copper enzyme maturation, permease component n=1 Tax=Propionispira arboris TaxID=84035 RepID=A0A1H7CVQ9_9FIRM|nr:hypothetical protein [Propionispira arboris]SEJ93661.1 hypothetical protein SAMN05660742_12623 [Propionispira arboris]